MLTASQAETVAYVTDGDIICRDCAIARYGEMGVAALDEGIAEFLPQDVSPLIRYELDSLTGETAYERARERADELLEDVPAEVLDYVETDRLIDDLAANDEGYPCGDCGEAIR